MLEYIFLGVIVVFISILFYKQANEQIEILQLNSERIHDLPTLLQERSPVVVRDYSTPPLGTPAELSKRPALVPLLSSRSMFSESVKASLATQSGLDIWFEHTWLPKLTTPLSRLWTRPRSRIVPLTEGLWKTTAPLTFFMPTQGAFRIRILSPSSEPYLPSVWWGKQFDSFTLQDTPLLSQIQYSELRVRHGHLLFLPPHLVLDSTPSDDPKDLEKKEEPWAYIVELHHPISFLARKQYSSVV